MKTGGTGMGCMGCLGQVIGIFILLMLFGGCVGLFVGDDETEPNTEEVGTNTETTTTFTGTKGKESLGTGEDVKEEIEVGVEEPVSNEVKEEVEEEPNSEVKEEVEKPTKYEVKETKEEPNQGNHLSVSLDRVVDGDTVYVYLNGERIGLRLLLIDTPETVHPKKPVEPYGTEASNRLKELLSNSNLTIEYDSGATTDHYGRHLVYLYTDGVSVHEVLISEGLARVGYIYEQVRYLDYYNSLQLVAKQNQLGIWSIPNYVNEAGEGFNSGTEDVSNTQSNTQSNTESSVEPSVSNEGKTYKNCEELKKDFPQGVSSDHPAYKASGDRDKDGWYCES